MALEATAEGGRYNIVSVSVLGNGIVRYSGTTTNASRRSNWKPSAPTVAHGFRRPDFPDAIRLSRNMSPASTPCRLEEAEDRFSSSVGNAGRRRESVRNPGVPRDGYAMRRTKPEGQSKVAITHLTKAFRGPSETSCRRMRWTTEIALRVPT